MKLVHPYAHKYANCPPVPHPLAHDTYFSTTWIIYFFLLRFNNYWNYLLNFFNLGDFLLFQLKSISFSTYWPIIQIYRAQVSTNSSNPILISWFILLQILCPFVNHWKRRSVVFHSVSFLYQVKIYITTPAIAIIYHLVGSRLRSSLKLNFERLSFSFGSESIVGVFRWSFHLFTFESHQTATCLQKADCPHWRID